SSSTPTSKSASLSSPTTASSKAKHSPPSNITSRSFLRLRQAPQGRLPPRQPPLRPPLHGRPRGSLRPLPRRQGLVGLPQNHPKSQSFSFYPAADEHRYFTLTIHRRHRDVITTDYIAHVLDQGKEIASRDRLKKLYTNNPSQNWSGWKANKWSHVQFEHPATFDDCSHGKFLELRHLQFGVDRERQEGWRWGYG
ncbi:AAA-ATPase ASD, mitochondrial, partial [Linum grandiflorum]